MRAVGGLLRVICNRVAGLDFPRLLDMAADRRLMTEHPVKKNHAEETVFAPADATCLSGFPGWLAALASTRHWPLAQTSDSGGGDNPPLMGQGKKKKTPP